MSKLVSMYKKALLLTGSIIHASGVTDIGRGLGQLLRDPKLLRHLRSFQQTEFLRYQIPKEISMILIVKRKVAKMELYTWYFDEV